MAVSKYNKKISGWIGLVVIFIIWGVFFLVDFLGEY